MDQKGPVKITLNGMIRWIFRLMLYSNRFMNDYIT